MSVETKKLSAYLLENNLIVKAQLDTCLKEIAEDHKSLEEKIIEHNILSEEKLGTLIADLFKTKFINLSNRVIPENILLEIPFSVAQNQQIIAFDKNKDKLFIATSNPENQEGFSFIQQKTGLKIIIYYTTPSEIKNQLKAYNKDIHDRFDKLLKNILKNPDEIESLKDVSKLLDSLIILAYEGKASDIHIEPQKKSVLVRFRMDGLLHDIINLPKEVQELITTRIKVLSNLHTDEHRAPQDGRFKIEIDNDDLTLRVSIVPIYDGEKIVLRILAPQNKTLTLEDLGYNKFNLLRIEDNIRKTHGMILVTGPTGSGKTTALYAILRELNSREVNIATIEDPIEYRLEGVNQIQVNTETRLTFSAGLRSLLRQDPDIIMVGEIRDNETATIAVNAALTGHLVLATLHTNNAASTLVRLIEMGVEPFLVSSTVIMTIAQRLIRKICDGCKEKYMLNKKELVKLAESLKLNVSSIELLHNIFKKKAVNIEEIYFYKAYGCKLCNNTGYKGRTCISEVIVINDIIKDLIMHNKTPEEIALSAEQNGFQSMFEDGIEKALNGSTSLEEILRVIRE